MPRRWKRPSWFALALLAVGLGAFTTLGFWQLDRAVEKEALLAAFAVDATRGPLALDDARRTPAALPYPRVRVHGRYDPVPTYVLDDQVRDGRQGIFAYAVFATDGGGPLVLVNRGFLAHGADGRPSAVPPTASGNIELTGIYAPPPGSGLRMGGNPLPRQPGWPKSTIYIDTAEIAQDLGRDVDARVLLLDPDPATPFVRAWTPQILPPERHRGYALQWFAFALAAIVIFIVLHWQRVTAGNR